MNIIRSVVALLFLLTAYSYSDTTRKMIKEGEKVYAIYYDTTGAEVAREECEIPKDLEVSLNLLSFSPYYGITSKLISGRIPDGVIKVADEDGTHRLQETYRDGKRNGQTKSYFKSGKVSSESNYVNGKLSGKLIAYSRDGKIASEVSFLDGELLTGNVYGMEANYDMNIGELLGRFGDKRRLSGKKIILITDKANKDTAKELKTLLQERGGEIVTAGNKKKVEETDKGADILIAELDYKFYDLIIFACEPETPFVDNIDVNNNLREAYGSGKIIAAVGDAEMVLARAGLLVSKEAAKPENPETESKLRNVQNIILKDGVVVSDRLVTAPGVKQLKELVSEISKIFKNE